MKDVALRREPVLGLVELERVATGRKTIMTLEDYRALPLSERAGTVATVFVRCSTCGSRNDVKGGLAELAAAVNGYATACTHGASGEVH